MQIDGALAVALARVADGEVLAQAGSLGEAEIAIHARGSAILLRAEIKTQRELELSDEIDDVLITLGARYHLIRPVPGHGDGASAETLFLLLLLNKAKANLAMARHKLGKMEEVTIFN